jgi:hypothetical protein
MKPIQKMAVGVYFAPGRMLFCVDGLTFWIEGLVLGLAGGNAVL